ncbi:MAG: hypothetical protein OXI88_09175 [Gammaproteobacteria bacterium]|nr:hypothetical protein [Gammaproteobacteria bacterium]
MMSNTKTTEELEIIEYLKNRCEYSRTKLKEMPDIHSRHGALEFQSFGGLLEIVMPHPAVIQYDYFNIEAKHIETVALAKDAVAAMYYLAGSCKVKDGPTISNYAARVTEVFVKEDGKWKGRIGHWSPLFGQKGLPDKFGAD